MRNSIFYVLSLLVLLSSTQISLSAESEYSEVNIKEPFKEYVLQDQMIMSGMLGVVTIPKEGQYLIAVGFTSNKTINDPSPRAKLNTMTVAKAKAKKAIVEFAESEIASNESVENKKETTTRKTEDGDTKTQIVKSKVVKAVIVVKAEGIVKDAIDIGYWYSKDMSFYYYAIAIKIPDK